MKILRSQNGFTLVELVVTAVFVTVASAAIITIFIVVGKLNKQARNMAVATALAEQKLEIYRDAGYHAIPTGAPAETFTGALPANFGSPKSAVANVTTPQAGLKRIDIIITYTDDKRTKNVQISTLMTQRGINR
ncbi:MAG TPA: hypothetical protein VF272_02350 [Candidatus Saccharimonadia bacterium]